MQKIAVQGLHPIGYESIHGEALGEHFEDTRVPAMFPPAACQAMHRDFCNQFVTNLEKGLIRLAEKKLACERYKGSLTSMQLGIWASKIQNRPSRGVSEGR